MKPFTITTPVLTPCPRRQGTIYSYYSRDRCILCHDGLAEYFEIDTHRKISLQLSSRASAESVAFNVRLEQFYPPPYGPYPVWQTHKYSLWNAFHNCVNEWLMKNTPVGDLKVGEKMTVHVTVYLEE